MNYGEAALLAASERTISIEMIAKVVTESARNLRHAVDLANW